MSDPPQFVDGVMGTFRLVLVNYVVQDHARNIFGDYRHKH